jgi:TnpA family transposase
VSVYATVTYEQLKRIGDWHLTEEAQQSALAALVSPITDLDTSARWGEGETAASDASNSPPSQFAVVAALQAVKVISNQKTLPSWEYIHLRTELILAGCMLISIPVAARTPQDSRL